MSKLDLESKWFIVSVLNLMFDNQENELPHGSISKVAELFQLDEMTIRNIYAQYLAQMVNGQNRPSLAPLEHAGRGLELTSDLSDAIHRIKF